jgi:RNA polymerase sigma factor (TIGR02999 family)
MTVIAMNNVMLKMSGTGSGEQQMSEDWLPLVYDELRRLAVARMGAEAAGQTLQPTALVHEAWVRLVEKGSRTWENRAHFFSAAAEAMRRILIERARSKARIKHGSGQILLDIADQDVAGATPDDKILLMDEALERLTAEDPETAQVVILKFFGGLSNEEIVAITGTSDSTVRRQWNYAKIWLYNCIRKQL